MQTVLLIEDDPNHIELAKRAVKKHKDEFILHICQSVQKTKIWLKDNQPDIILVDLNLPDGTALELINKAKNDVFCPWIVITSQGNEKLAVEVMKSGAEDYVVKSPEMFHEMPHLITKTLQSWQLKLAHQQTELNLKKREALLKTILETAQDGYWLVDHSGLFLEINQAYCTMIGYDENELIGQHIQFVEAEEDKTDITNKINRLIQTGKDRFETKHRRKDGHLIDVEVSTTYINIDQGYFVCFLRDLTAKNKAEQDLLASERSYRQLVDTAYEGIWVFDQTYHLSFVNQRLADMLGYTAAEMIGKSIVEFISPNDLEDLHQKKEQQKLGVPAQFERTLICKDGSELVTLISASPLLDETGSFQGTFGMVTDISELKKIQHSLTISEERFRRTFDLSPVGKALVDMDFKFIRCNQAFCEFLGYEENELLSKSYKDVTYAEDIYKGKVELQKLINNEIDTVTLQKRYKHKNGEELWGETSIRLLVGEDGKTKYFLPVIQNIHQRKLADEKIKEREAKLESIFRASPIGMGIVVDRVFVEVNDHMCKMTGYTREELIGKNSIWIYPNEKSYDFVGKEKYRQITEKGTGTVETVWRHKKGHLINVLLSSTPLDQSDWKKGVTFTVLDITERTMFVRFLAESEAPFTKFHYDFTVWKVRVC
jgi:PAS domain S-box-containing protein